MTIFSMAVSSFEARANVYATNVRLNGATTNAALSSGGSVLIGYLLNEPATLGVTVDIKQGDTIFRSIVLTNGGPGTAVGTNAVSWDGTDGAGHMLPGGAYAVSITARASGYTNWTQISSDSNTNNQCTAPRGVAVNVNTNSIYYGRIFMANAATGPNAPTFPGDRIGILKLNADSSAAAEGIFANGGYNWSHGSDLSDYVSPEKIEIGPDDRVYINDAFNVPPTILSFDQTISTNSLRTVLAPANFPNDDAFDGPFITQAGTNLQIWMADKGEGVLAQGIVRWNLGTNGTVPAFDTGTSVVALGTNLNQFPMDVAVDRSNRIYTIQSADDQDYTDNRVMRFPAYTNVAQTNTDWIFVTNTDRYVGGNAVAVNTPATLVAAAFYGIGGQPTGNGINGSTAVFDANTGALIANLAPTNTPGHQFLDVAWDNAGNLYAVDQGDPQTSVGLLRIYSPPGTNQATTLAIPVIQLSGSQPQRPVLSVPVYQGQFVQFTLNGEANMTYVILGSTNLNNWAPIVTNTSPNAVRAISVPASGNQQFYRAKVGP